MHKIKILIHIAVACLTALLYAPIASAVCGQQTVSDNCSSCPQQTLTDTYSPCKPEASAPCYVVGSNGEFCSSEPEEHLDDAEWRPEFQCYIDYGICERDENGMCGWRNTDGLAGCIDDMRRGILDSIEPCVPVQSN